MRSRFIPWPGVVFATIHRSVEDVVQDDDKQQFPTRSPSIRSTLADLVRPDLYLNRELSILEFNRRVLERAQAGSVPLLERLRFLCIVSANLDEFFEIRVAALQEQTAHGADHPGPDGLTPTDQLRQIADVAHRLVRQQYVILNEHLIPELAEHDIRFLRRSDWTPAQTRWIRRFFSQELLPLLSPQGLDPAHPFPKLLNKSLNFVVLLEGTDAFGRVNGTAVVQVPRLLPRVIHIPPQITKRSLPPSFS